MKLDVGDEVIHASLIEDMGEVVVISDRGYAKRTFIFDYDIQGRNGKGVKTFDFKKNGSNGRTLIAAFCITEPVTIKTQQLHGTETIIESTEIASERRASTGRVAVVSVLDDLLVSAVICKREEQNTGALE